MNHEDTTTGPHVLLVSCPLQGHVNPLLRLGSRLAAKGLLVTVSTFRHVGLRAMHGDGSCVDVGRGRLRFEYLRDDSCCCLGPDDMVRRAEVVGPSALADLIRRQAGAGRPVSCVVNNPFVPWALDVAEGMGIPRAMLWIQSFAVLSLYYHFYNSPDAAFPTDDEPGVPVVLPGLPVLAADELPFMVRPAYAQTFWGHILRRQLADLRKSVPWVLVNTFDELEHSAIEALCTHAPVIPVGPLLEPEHDVDKPPVPDDSGFMEWLDAQPPRSVVYVAFGSLVNIGGELMAAVAEGLISTGRPFLWVVRDDSRELLPDGLAAGSDNGKIVAWCPQSRVLGHSAVGCFVTHCGWNSIAEALAAGVPIVGYPWWSDQFTNAKFLVDVYKVGVRLPVPVTRDALRRCVEEVTSGPESEAFQMRAARWKEKARAAVADGGSSERGLQAFVDHVTMSGEAGR